MFPRGTRYPNPSPLMAIKTSSPSACGWSPGLQYEQRPMEVFHPSPAGMVYMMQSVLFPSSCADNDDSLLEVETPVPPTTQEPIPSRRTGTKYRGHGQN